MNTKGLLLREWVPPQCFWARGRCEKSRLLCLMESGVIGVDDDSSSVPERRHLTLKEELSCHDLL